MQAAVALAQDEGVRSASHTNHLTPCKMFIGTHYMGGRVGHRVSLDFLGEEKNVIPLLGIQALVIQPIL